MKNINEFLSKGFTLVEVLTVTVILGVMAGLAIPTYNGIIEKQGANEAYVNLQTIYRAEKLYHAKNGTYWEASGTLSVATISQALNIDLVAPKYYPVFKIGPRPPANITTSFKATASKS